jgi:hypothetical protein
MEIILKRHVTYRTLCVCRSRRPHQRRRPHLYCIERNHDNHGTDCLFVSFSPADFCLLLADDLSLPKRFMPDFGRPIFHAAGTFLLQKPAAAALKFPSSAYIYAIMGLLVRLRGAFPPSLIRFKLISLRTQGIERSPVRSR